MRILNGIKWAFLLAVITTAANADLILDNDVVITDITGISVSPTNGHVYLTTRSKNYTVTSGDTTPPPTGSVVINSFTATATIEEGESTFVSWSTSNATSCAALGNAPNWSGTKPRSSSGVAVKIATKGNYTLTLRCQGTNGPVSKSRAVTVTEASTTPIPTTCDSPPLAGNVKTWRSFWAASFPGPGSSSETLTVPIRGYTALKFNTGNITDDGKLTSIETTQTIGVRVGTISECPGDFDVPSPACDHVWGLGGGIRWSINGSRTSTDTCQLKANTDYYFNLTFTDGFDKESSSCLVQPCMTLMQHSNR